MLESEDMVWEGAGECLDLWFGDSVSVVEVMGMV